MVSFRSASRLAFPVVLVTACATEVQDDIFDPTTTGESSSSTTDLSTSSTTDEGSSSSTGDEGSTSSTSGSTGDDSAGGQLCGDGAIDGTEQCDCSGGACDEMGLGGMGCADTTDPLNPERVLTGGTLGCNPASCQYIVDECVWCGDGTLNGNEGCEPELTIATDCNTLGEGVVGALACDDTCQLDTTACTDCFIEEDFSTCPVEWTTQQLLGQASTPTWACGDPDAHAGGPGVGETGVWGTNITGNYDSSESSALISPAIDLSTPCGAEGVTLTIRHWYNFEGGVTNADGGVVQVSTDGASWTTLVPTDGQAYSANNVDAGFTGCNAMACPVDGNPGFSAQGGNESTWQTSTFDISAYNGEAAVQFRFVFGSDTSGTSAGWYIDTFTIQGLGV